MKNIILAVAIGLSSLVGLSAPSQAASPMVVDIQSNSMVTEVQYRHDRRHDRRYDRRDHRRDHRYDRRHNRNCFMRATKHRYHGRIVVRRERVCH